MPGVSPLVALLWNSVASHESKPERSASRVSTCSSRDCVRGFQLPTLNNSPAWRVGVFCLWAPCHIRLLKARISACLTNVQINRYYIYPIVYKTSEQNRYYYKSTFKLWHFISVMDWSSLQFCSTVAIEYSRNFLFSSRKLRRIIFYGYGCCSLWCMSFHVTAVTPNPKLKGSPG